MDFRGMLDRAVGAALLRTSVYEEIERNGKLNQEALAVVALAAVADGLGLLLRHATESGGLQIGQALLRLAFGVLAGIFVYYVMAFLIHYIGVGWLGGKGGVDQVRRTLGFAYGPRALGLLAFLPGVGSFLGTVGWLWFLVAAFVASRQALDVSNSRTLVAVAIAAVAGFFLFFFFAFMLGIVYLPFAAAA